eukprot:TRINITY_DN17227_c0_g1_i1.p1 TRINITY_DN17227_c0_g1~~TRINITY_DN17227_c0_g1_i1.p1  ORF type:complete len:112 (+),score=17.28 TRINITY_DN17227_c0_g1_i1:40-375(+)
MATEIIRGIAIEATGSLIGTLGADFLNALRTSSSFQMSQPHAGAVWISATDGNWGTWSGMVLSAYYHPSKQHTATTTGKMGVKQSTAAAGQWAISHQSRSLMGNKANYNTL